MLQFLSDAGQKIEEASAAKTTTRGDPVRWPRLGARLKLSSALAATVPTTPPNTSSGPEHRCATDALSYKFGRRATLFIVYTVDLANTQLRQPVRRQ